MRIAWFGLWLGACSQPVVFATVQDEVLAKSCAFSSCHGASAGTGGLLLDGTAADYARLVGPVSAVAGLPLVVPGAPDDSYLVHKLSADPDIEGDAMPPGSGLDADGLSLVRAWIEDGALP
jgi:hypothetical protein